MANLLNAIAQLLDVTLTLYMWAVIIRAVLSWISLDPNNPFVRFLHSITDPVLARIRRYVPTMGGLDLSPMVVILGIYFIQLFLVSTLRDLADVLR